MARKPTGLLPADLAPARRVDPANEDFHNSAWHALNRTPHPPEVIAAALERMERLAPDLIEMLGLREPTPGNSRPIDIHCPSCPASPSGRCVSKAGNEIGHFHAARVRKAADTVAVEQLINQIIEDAA